MPLDQSDRIAVALQVLRKRHHLDVDAVAAVFQERFEQDVVRRAIQRGIGIVCDSDTCSAWPEVSEARREEARELLRAEQMSDLLVE